MANNVTWVSGKYRDVDETLCIPPDVDKAEYAFLHVAPFSESLWHNHYNVDESKVQQYKLPQFRSTTVREWEDSERPEILQMYKDILYGQMPPAPERIEAEQLSYRDDALDGLAVRKEIRIHLLHKDKHFYFDMLLYVPKNVSEPPPVFVGLNFLGNQANTPDDDVRNTRSCNFVRDTASFKRSELHNVKMDSWNFAEAARRGYAVATACYGEICPDYMTGIKVSPFTLFYDEKDLRLDYEVPFSESRGGKWRRPVSSIGAWAWALSRMLDVLETEELVDAGRAAVVGHSRLGKTALWAGAYDERFKLVITNNSGCGGAALYRRNFGESVFHSFFEQRAWFAGNLASYVLDVNKLPFDQHMLLALVAPRTVYVASASEDLNADPKGEFLSAFEASKIWQLYGKNGLTSDVMPPADTSVGTDVCYHLRTGAHAITERDWVHYYAVADRMWKKK